MSNFKTFAQTLQGQAGTASVRYSASTSDSLATILAAGYMDDKSHVVKANDIIEINYADTTVLPAQITAIYGQFMVVASGSNLNLVVYPNSLVVGALVTKDVTITSAALAGAAQVSIIPALSGAQYKIRDMFTNSGGTNFSGGGGDRLLSITDGTTVYSVIPAASLQTLANVEWGSTGLPFPASAPVNRSTVAGQALRAVYSGGTADYTAGSMVLTIVYERV